MIRSFMWAVRRELWESRWLYLAPLSMAAVIVVGFTAYAFRLPAQMSAIASLDILHQRKAIVEPYDTVAGLMMVAGLLFGIIYCVMRCMASGATAAFSCGSRCRCLMR